MNDPIAVPLTERQKNILGFIVRQCRKNGFPPTIREIGKAFDIDSPNGVICHLTALVKKGCIRRDKSRARAIVLLPKGFGDACPFCGNRMHPEPHKPLRASRKAEVPSEPPESATGPRIAITGRLPDDVAEEMSAVLR